MSINLRQILRSRDTLAFMAKSPKKVKISAFLNSDTHQRVKTEAKQSGVSLVDYVSDSVEQRLRSVERKRSERKSA